MSQFITVSTGTNRTFWEVIRSLCGINALATLVNSKASQAQVAALSTSVIQKANREQPAWQDLPLTAGSANDPANIPQFYKDTTGHVHLRGKIWAADLANAATLPVGFRPAKQQRHLLETDAMNVAKGYVNADGTIQVLTGIDVNPPYVSLCGIAPFRAEL